MVGHPYHSSTWEAEGGGLRVQGQLRLHSENQKRSNVESPCDPVVPLLSIFTREKKTHVHRKTCK
jgi:hypothetical protein